MKILLTNISLKNYQGTESWTYAMAKELSKEHEVTVFTKELGLMSDKIEELGVKVVQSGAGDYDFALINHNNFWKEVKCPKLFTSHSNFLPIEQPTREMGDDWIGVNEYICPRVIRNGIDLERFKPTKINKELKNILYLSNPTYSKGKDFIREVFKDYNVITLDEQTFDINEYIDKADLVISYARGAIESLVSGKKVIYGDWRHDTNCFMGYGMITEDNYELFKNGDMRKNLRKMDADTLLAETSLYDPLNCLSERSRQDYDIKKTTKEYIRLISGKIPKTSG